MRPPHRHPRTIASVAAVALLGVLAAVAPAPDAGAQVGVGAPPVTAVDPPPGGPVVTVAPTAPAPTAPPTTAPVVGPVPAGSATTTTLTTTLTPTLTTTTVTIAPPTTTTLLPAGTPTTSTVSTIASATTSTKPPTTGPATVNDLRNAVIAALSSSTAATRSVEISIDGMGTVVALDADQARPPASTQKIYVAAAALQRFGAAHHFVTEVRTTTGIAPDGSVAGDLVLRASGDPSLTLANLRVLADGVAKSGVKVVRGGLALDDAIFDVRTRLDIWKPSFTPGEVGSLSALIVDGNHRTDADSLRDPGLANLRRFRTLLVAKGIQVGAGEKRLALGDGGPVVASVSSAPLLDLVTHMLKKSDNTYAEVLTKHLGRQSGVGSTTSGVAAIAAFFGSLGLVAPTAQVDGSGLSVLNRSSAHQQVQFLRKVSSTDVGLAVVNALPIACVDGTLRGRFCQTSGANVVKAKTGAIDNVSSLVGLTQTASGRRVVFSFLLNGTTSSARARAAIDKALVAVSSATV